MEIVWNKLVIWIMAIALALVVILLLVTFLNPSAEGSFISRFFSILSSGQSAAQG
jgi:hypothetical protein